MGRQPFQDEGGVVTVVTARTRAEYQIARPRKENSERHHHPAIWLLLSPGKPDGVFVIMLDGTFFSGDHADSRSSDRAKVADRSVP
jgi:hypothetical protein